MNTAVIAYDAADRYDPLKLWKRAGAMTDRDDRADLERRVKAGEWLSPGSAAIYLGIGRTKVHKLLTSGEIGYRKKPQSRHRICNPADLIRLREEFDRELHGEPPAAPESP